jgi:nucleoside 2-deoxyribosyltransferase
MEKKVSYANGKPRVLDLDQTYSILIKPVFDALKIPCYRAIDKNINGSIDKLMLQEIKNADIALVDVSTLNANVMWELGVRHALKEKHTIVICEEEQMSSIPFDINHFIVHKYTHSEQGIPYLEVDRFRNYLTDTINKMLAQNPEENDSPVFTFLKKNCRKKQIKIPPQLMQNLLLL